MISETLVLSDTSHQKTLEFTKFNIDYADAYDFASKKKSLKEWEIEMGIYRQELDLPWGKPVPVVYNTLKKEV